MKTHTFIILSVLLMTVGCSLADDYYEIKDVYVSGAGVTLTYGFCGPNALDKALSAYCSKMGIPKVSASQLSDGWVFNSNLDTNVKNAMTDGLYDYSFTYYSYGGYTYFVANKKQCGEYYIKEFVNY